MSTYELLLAKHALVFLSLSAAGTYSILISERRKSNEEVFDATNEVESTAVI
jgi:hypothetical protein